MWLRSSLATFLLVVFPFGASEQHVLQRRQSSPPLPEKYSVYVKPLPSNKNHHSFPFVGEQRQPPKHSLKKLDQQKELPESSLPKYQLPLVPHFQTKKLEQSSKVQLSSSSVSKASVQLEHQELNSQLQHQFSTQIVKSQLPLTPQVQSHNNQSNQYENHPTLSPQSYSKVQTSVSPKSQHQALTQSLKNHYKLPIPAHTLSLHKQFNSEQSQIPRTYSLQHKHLKDESLPSSNSDKADDIQHKKASQVIFINGQPIVINPTESKKTPSSAINQNSHDSHAFLSSPTTDAIFKEKLLGSVQSQVQSVIQKAPASEIEYNKGGPASDRDNKDDAYVVYYYYYYDDYDESNNKTSPSLKFDDIPNLENYDESKTETTNVKKDVRRVGQRGNVPTNVISNAFSDTSLSKDRSGQPRTSSLNNSAQSKVVDISSKPAKDPVLPIAPVSNVYRYGNDVSRFPVTQDLVNHTTKNQKSTIVTDISVEDKEDNLSVNPDVQDYSTTIFSEDDLSSKSDLFSSVKDSESGAEINEIVEAQTESLTRRDPTIEIKVTKTIESTTTQEPVTTTVSVPSRFSNRRRFGSRRPPGSFRSRRPSVIDSTTAKVVKTEAPKESTESEESTTVSTTTIKPVTTTSSRSRFRSRLGNRRLNTGFNRQRPSFRRNRFTGSNNDSDNEKDEEDSEIEKKSTEKETTTTSTTTVTESSRPKPRRRFGSFGSSRRFGNSRSRSSSATVSSETTSNDDSTTIKTTTGTSRIRPSSIFGRSKTRSRLSFFRRGRNGFSQGSKAEEEPENDDDETPEEEEKSSTPKIADKATVTSLSVEDETTTTTDSLISNNEDEYDVEEEKDLQTSEDPTTTTTENSRFSGLFRKRNRPTLFRNRPRL